MSCNFKYIFLTVSQGMSTNLKWHNFNAILTIHQINITVKFPCAVAIVLKLDSKQYEFTKEQKLVNGRVQLQETISSHIRLTYNIKSSMYSQKKASLIVYLKSSSGKIPAGSATIHLKSAQQHKKCAVGIEKCPDKAAKIVYSLKLQFLNDEDCFQESLIAKSSTNLHERQRKYQTVSRQNSRKILKTDLQGSRISGSKNVYDDRSDNKSQTNSQQSRISKLIMKEHENQVNSQRQKILELEKEKVKAMKEIRHLKHQIQTNQLQKSNVSDRQDTFFNAKRQSRIRILEDEVQSQKNKVSDYQSDLHQKRLKMQELEKQIKMLQRKNQQLEEQNRQILTEKDKSSTKKKQFQFQLKQAKEKYEDQVLMHQNYVKRVQFKQNAYKEQIKTLNDKYTSSESEKQRLLFEKNQLINEHDERQKKDKMNSRDRERALNEQKNRLMKKLDPVEKQLATKKDEKQNLQNQLRQKEIESKKYKASLENSQLGLEEMRRQLNELKSQLQKQSISKKAMQDKLQKNQKMNEEKRTLKRNLNQMEHEHNQQAKLVAGLQLTKKNLTKKTQQLEHSLKQKTAANKVLQKEFDALNKKHQSFKKSQQTKTQQLADVTFMKQNQEGKVHGLHEQMKELQRKLRQMQNEYKVELENKQNRIYELEEDTNELNEKNFVLNQKHYNVQKNGEEVKLQLQIKMDKIQKLQRQLLAGEEKILTLENKLKEMGQLHETSSSSFTKEFQKCKEQINELQRDKKQLQRRIQKLGLDADDNASKFSTDIKNLQQQLMSKEKEIFRMKQEMAQQQSRRISVTGQAEELEHELRLKSQQIQFYKESIDKNRKDQNDGDLKLKQAKVQIQGLESTIKQLNQRLDELGKDKDSITNQEKKIKYQFDKYKTSNIYHIKSFFHVLHANEIKDSANVVHEEEEVVKMMMEALEKKKENQRQNQNYFNELSNQIKTLTESNQAYKYEVQQKNEEIQEMFMKIENLNSQNSDGNKELSEARTTYEKTIQQLKHKINNLEQDIQKLESSGSNLNTVLHDKSQEIQFLTGENGQLTKIIANLEEKITVLTKSSQEELASLIKQSNGTASDLKNQLETTKQKLIQEEKKVIQMTQKNSGSEGIIGELRNYISKLESEGKESKSTIGNLEKEIANKTSTIAKYQKNSLSAQNTIESANAQNKHLHEKIVNLQTSIKGLNQKIEKINEKHREEINNWKKKDQELNDQINKLNIEINKLQRQVVNEKSKVQNGQTIKKSLEGKILEQENTMKGMRKQIDNLTKKVNLVTHESAGEKTRFTKENQQTIKKFTQQLKLKTDQIQEMKTTISKVKSQKQNVSKNLSQLQRSYAELKEEKGKSSGQMSKRINGLEKQKQQLNSQLSMCRQQFKTVQSNLTQVTKTFEQFQQKNNNQASFMKPMLQKLTEMSKNSQDYSRFLSVFENSKNKLMKISSTKIENYEQKFLGDAIRQINIASQKCKLQIINKFKVTPEDKMAIVEEFKKLQIAIEKINKHS